jgi:hypothetical protein
MYAQYRWLVALHHEEGHPVFVSTHLAVRSTNVLLCPSSADVTEAASFCSTAALLVGSL